MATLIQSKQIEGVVTASVVAGDFSISGSLLVSGSGIFTNDISASGVISASSIFSTGPIYGVRYNDVQDTPNFVSGTGISITQLGNNITITNTGVGTQPSGSIFNGGEIGNKITLTPAASSSGIALADIEFIKGAFYSVPLYNDLERIPISRISNNQIVWVEEAGQTYQAVITLANPPLTYTDSVSWNEFFGFAVAGADITSVIAGSGLTGGGFVGSVTLNVGAGDGISVSANAVSLNTSSAHFQEGVEFYISSGSYIIDLGII